MRRDLGLRLGLTRFWRAKAEDIVLLVHGLTASSDMFVMPEHYNLARYLLDNGLEDVWALDSRMSNRFPYNTEPGQHTLDDVAHYDYPAALAEVRRHVGRRRIHVIAHCVGSTSFMMSLYGGAVTGVASVTCQSVALVVRVPRWSRWKLDLAPEVLELGLGLTAVDPQMAAASRFSRGRLLSRLVSLAHQECDNPACHMVSFMWGTGWPALFSHANLTPATHDRVADLLGPVGVHYYRHIRKMVRAGRAVKYDAGDRRHADLPDDYLVDAARQSTPVLFLTGAHNNVFRDANVACHRLLSRYAPDLYELAVLPGYGYVDPFWGKDAHRDVFPVMLDFLKRRAN
ncbi:alpha/beta fold hydrolase [Streptomyces sp. 8K308]|uniref:alpha/beta fold hydrolase n=1 Tax=Streptomyces sp. 8K308 TaxID=2530388 RepID=UPI001A9DDF78|nr:alpha/beta fold hydrolase [Streptomyces sp. 8K308]